MDVIKDKKIFEIGPGSGNLTNYIIQKKPKTILLIEKDKRFYEILSKKYRFKKNYKIINEDILNYDLNKHEKEDAIILEIFHTISQHKYLPSLLAPIYGLPFIKNNIHVPKRSCG